MGDVLHFPLHHIKRHIGLSCSTIAHTECDHLAKMLMARRLHSKVTFLPFTTQ